ncbi:MAG: response regulator [Spirochaetes bacterium]|nr:response regulator [Spirochaetota bacterium]
MSDIEKKENSNLDQKQLLQVLLAYKKGDFSQRMPIDNLGLAGKISDVLNNIIEQSDNYIESFLNISQAVGEEGEIEKQLNTGDLKGRWGKGTKAINSLITSIVSPVMEISRVINAVAKGDLSQQMEINASDRTLKGEYYRLGKTVNVMVSQLSAFAKEIIRVAREVGVDGKLGGQAKVPKAMGIWKDLTNNVNQLAANLTTQVRAISEVATAVAKGDHSRTITVDAGGEVAELKDYVNQMIENLKNITMINQEQDWLKTNLAKFARNLQGQRDLQNVAKMILSDLANLINVQYGVFYTIDQEENETFIKLIASYAYKSRKHLSNRFKPGEGLIGQCLLEKDTILVTDAPEDYISIESGLGEGKPNNLIVLPIIFENEVKAIIELATFSLFKEIHLIFLDQLRESIGVVINTIAANMQTKELLKQSQTLTERLQNQQEELQKTNEELEDKARLLADQNREVEQKNIEVENKNKEIELARMEVENKAEQLAVTSKYKSEFLANMSHELRTPLNSLLVLSKMLCENKNNNLSKKEVDFASNIYEAGNDLLTLLNDILDLAKVEAGKIELSLTEFSITDVKKSIEKRFREIANKKKLNFTITLQQELPKIYTDEKRLQQILINLLSNAFKFTEKGHVTLNVKLIETKTIAFMNNSLKKEDKVFAFSVTDTGIGIPEEKINLVFEAFQQAESTTTRRFGGTGLGLSISREVTGLLGGEIHLQSTLNQGSTFILYLPLKFNEQKNLKEEPQLLPPPKASAENKLNITPLITKKFEERSKEINDDLGNIHAGDRVILIIENDIHFAHILLEVARSMKFKGIIALNGESGWEIIREYKPDAITLDLKIPGINGWVLLDMLKHDSELQHIPVHVISVAEEQKRAFEQGAFSFLKKTAQMDELKGVFAGISEYIERKIKNLLVIEDDEKQNEAIVKLIGNGDVKTVSVKNGREALAALNKNQFDCIILDLILPDMSGLDFLEKIKDDNRFLKVPIIVYTAKDLTKTEERKLQKLTNSIILKNVRSPERLLMETTLFLHRIEHQLPEEKKKILKKTRREDGILSGKKVLIVDDDLRNIFILTSVLEKYNMKIIYAENGKEGIKKLAAHSDIDLVLMDVMMPVLDGYDAMKKIRKMEQYKAIPIITLTAKTMKGDQEKCLEAGASDYISKPIDIERLLSLMRVWMYH